MPVRAVALALLHAALVAAPALAGGAPVGGDPSLVPGRMGYNAIPTLVAADPAIGDELAVELSGVVQASDLASATDASALPYVRVFVPFRRVAALEVDAIPFEAWRVGPATQERLAAVHGSGTTKGDVRLTTQFALYDETPAVPALGLRLHVKTASGKGIEDRRFLAAPAYGVDLLAGKTLPWKVGVFRVRVVGSAGFLAWQQGSARQDDAFMAAARLLLGSPGRSRLALDWRAYWGWQQEDQPMVLGVTGGWRVFDSVELLGTLDRGLTRDAPPWALRVGVVLYVDARSVPGIGTTIASARP